MAMKGSKTSHHKINSTFRRPACSRTPLPGPTDEVGKLPFLGVQKAHRPGLHRESSCHVVLAPVQVETTALPFPLGTQAPSCDHTEALFCQCHQHSAAGLHPGFLLPSRPCPTARLGPHAAPRGLPTSSVPRLGPVGLFPPAQVLLLPSHIV